MFYNKKSNYKQKGGETMKTIQQQFFYSIEKNRVRGQSKRADRLDPHKSTKDKIYSDGRERCLKDTAKQFSKFIKSNYPEIKYIKDIRPEHLQAFIDTHAAQWTKQTQDEKISQMRKLEHLARETYGIKKINITEGVQKRDKITKATTRNISMSPRDLELIRENLANGRTAAKIAVELTARAGLRNREAAHLKPENIDIKNRVINITEGAKGGKYRTIPIRDKDFYYFKELKESVPEGAYICDVKPASISRGIRRALENCGLSKKYEKTSEHAIRKLYAKERMEELTGTTTRSDPRENKKELKAWQQVQQELGHTDNFRPKLYEVYILQ